MDGCKCQMHSIRSGNSGENLLAQQSSDDLVCFRAGAKLGHAREDGQPFGGKVLIAASHFIQHGFRDEQVKFLSAQFPPFLCGFLIRRQPQVPTASRYEVTRNGRFNVKPGLHLWIYTATTCSLPPKNCFNHFIAARNPMGRTSASL